jgi:hypothetical protein
MKNNFLKKMTALSLVGVLVTTFSPFGASAATTKYVSNQNILKQMVSKMSEVESMNFDGTLSIKPPASKTSNSTEVLPFTKISMKFFGSSLYDKADDKNQSTFSLMALDQTGEDLYPHFEAVTDGDTSYLKVSNLELLSSLLKAGEAVNAGENPSNTTTPSGLEGIDNQWIKIGPDSLKNVMQTLMGSTVGSGNGDTSLSQIYLDQIMSQRQNDQKEALDELTKIFNVAEKKNLFTITRLKDEVVDNVSTYHLKLGINKLRIKPFLVESQKVMGGEQMSAKEINAVVKDLAKIQLPSLEVWVGKNDFLLRKFNFNMKVKESSAKNAGYVELGFNMNFNSFNNAAPINVPAQSKKIEDVVKDFTQSLDNGRSQALTALSDDSTSTLSQNPVFFQTKFSIPKTDKPKVEFFAMSQSPYSVQAEKALIPAWELLKDKADINLRFVSYIMQGARERDDNTLQYCVQKEEPEKLIPFLKCFVGIGDSKSCLLTVGIDQTKLNKCVAQADQQYSITAEYNNQNHWLSGQFPLYNIDKDLNEKYGVFGSPTIVINGEKVDMIARSPEGMKEAICSAFVTRPVECLQTLSSQEASAGFGKAF